MAAGILNDSGNLQVAAGILKDWQSIYKWFSAGILGCLLSRDDVSVSLITAGIFIFED